MRKIITNGALYLALPPLYKINLNNIIKYAFNEKEKNNILKNVFKNNKNTIITRFKGLGEMPSEQLKNTTMNINKRKLIKITQKHSVKEIKKIDKIFESLMGKKAELRFKFIKENANFTTNLDY